MDATELSILTMKRAFADQIARQFFGDGSGTLGVINTVTTLSPGVYELNITNASWLQAPWMLNDLLNIDIGTDLFLITNIDLVNQNSIFGGGLSVPGDAFTDCIVAWTFGAHIDHNHGVNV